MHLFEWQRIDFDYNIWMSLCISSNASIVLKMEDYNILHNALQVKCLWFHPVRKIPTFIVLRIDGSICVTLMHHTKVENSSTVLFENGTWLVLWHSKRHREFPVIEAEYCRTYASLNYAIIGPGHGLLPDRYPDMIWTRTGMVLIGRWFQWCLNKNTAILVLK